MFIYSYYIDTRSGNYGLDKHERGKQEGGKEKVGKHAPISSNPAGFRSSQHTSGPLTTDPLTPSISNVEESDSNTSDSSLPTTVPSQAAPRKVYAQEAKASRTSEGSSTASKNKDTSLSRQRHRYIAFIGNLPFTATGDDLIQQFEKKGVCISQVRLLTDKASGASRGCCFAEFPNARTLQASSLHYHTYPNTNLMSNYGIILYVHLLAKSCAYLLCMPC